MFLLASLVIILSSHFFNFLAPLEELKMTYDMGLASILFFGMLIAIFSCGELIPREIERQTISTILSKPVTKSQFIYGKFLGGVLLVFLNFLLMSAVFLIIIYFKSKNIPLDVIKILFLTFLELTVLSSIAVLFSTISTTPSFNATITFFIYIIGHLTDYIIHIAGAVENIFLSVFIWIIYSVLPNFNNFNLRDKITEGFAIPGKEILKISAYGIIYIMIMLILANIFFRDREF